MQDKNSREQGVLVLTDGERMVGRIRRVKQSFRVSHHGRVQTVPIDRVQRWLTRKDLVARLTELEKLPNAQSPFALAQRTAWAFENGLADLAWPLLGKLNSLPKSPAGLRAVERAAVQERIASVGPRRSLEAAGKEILLRVRSGKNPLQQARNRVAALAVAELLRRETEAGKSIPVNQSPRHIKRRATSLEKVCRKYAEESLGERRRVARQALLTHDNRGRHFVYRLAIRVPAGPTRRSIIGDIRSQGRAADAASYIGAFLLQAKTLGMKTRSAGVLGDIGSSMAMPALRAAKKQIPELMATAKRRSTAGGGATRASLSVITQQAYVRDFNVEVAQAAAIGDPVVGVLSHGVVLDVTVGGISWTRYVTYLDTEIDRAMKKIGASR